MTSSQKWFRIVLSAPHGEERAYELIELGATGVETLSDSTIAGSFHLDPLGVAPLQRKITDRGFSIESTTELREENWVQRCEAFFVPVSVGELRITPIINSDQCPPPAPREVFVVPGFGFGTGHHPSTRMILSLMQSPLLSAVKSIADVGTGSGILSAAAALLYPAASIHAIDNDEQALISAVTTTRLNPSLENRIHIELGSFEKLRGPYDLILANLYEEVFRLGAMPLTTTVKSPGGILIVSGLFVSQEPTLDELFPSAAWTLDERREEEGWIARRYIRK